MQDSLAVDWLDVSLFDLFLGLSVHLIYLPHILVKLVSAHQRGTYFSQ